MQIKTYKAASMKEVLAQIKTEMGPNAVIVSTRQFKDDTYGLMTKPVVEVTAAVDYDAMRGGTPQTPKVITLPPQIKVHDDVTHLSAEITELKGMMKTLLTHTGVEHNRENPLRDAFIDRGLKPSLVDLMFSKLGDKASMSSVMGLLAKVIRTSQIISDKFWIFLGTTGVGKTTTIAKIAARAVFQEGKKVALITLDTYRIGAIEQGRIYAKILGIPFVSVTTPDEFRQAEGRFRAMDLVLVDTIGRSLSSDENIAQLREYCDGKSMCKFLLIPVATRDREMESTTRTFAPLSIDRMIFTKADEAVIAGTVLTHNLLFRTPIAYITNGQRVPEDIEVATPEKIITMCLGDMA